MTQEEKQLLLKDLCARLPYGVICRLSVKDADVSIIEKLEIGGLEHFISGTMDVKPYLRSMSSITEEEVFDYIVRTKEIGCIVELPIQPRALSVDWLNAHHFDYRGLIEKGLALEALEGMYKIS